MFQVSLRRATRALALPALGPVLAALLTVGAGEVLAQSCAPPGLSPLSGCIPASGARDVAIGATRGAQCTSVYVDGSYVGAKALGTIKIEAGGSLFVRDQAVTLEVNQIEVDGLLQVGTPQCPIGAKDPANTATIVFTGKRPCPGPGPCANFDKGILVRNGGTLSLAGIRGVPAGSGPPGTPNGISWTHLSAPAGPDETAQGPSGPSPYGPSSGTLKPVPAGGARTIQLARDVTVGNGAWRKNDWIAVASTSFSPFETEFVQIADLKPNGATKGTDVILKTSQPLLHYHFGGKDPGVPGKENFNVGSELNYGVDERAEVGLISRNVRLTAKIDPDSKSLHWGGEIKILRGFKQVAIQGVEIEKFGKDQLGSYPIHFHEIGSTVPSQSLVNANSIHHSYNKCMTVHSTTNITFRNNVCARVVGHIFYQEIGDEEGIRYLNNLGLGAMSNAFEIHAATSKDRDDLISEHFWAGDYLGQSTSPTYNGYDGLNVPNRDAQTNPTHGSCFSLNQNKDGSLVLPPVPPFAAGDEKPPCVKAGLYYTEPASGFWIINPSTDLIGNSIAGCQGVGRGYWYVPPPDPANTAVKFNPVGEFRNNRVHGCYAGLYAEPEFGVVSEQLFPRVKEQVGDQRGSRPIVAKFDGITATRNRFRGIWLRPTWFAVTNARLATNRESISLVTAGGTDGLIPGVWSLFKDSVVVGLSENNVDRFGPCPDPTNGAIQIGCIDVTPLTTLFSTGGDVIGDAYPNPRRNFFGFMVYDGPVRIFDNHYAQFKRDIRPRLTKDDQAFLDSYSAKQIIPNVPSTNTRFVYEGDAAYGWFQANQSAYPTSTATKGNVFTEVDLRHQIYTDAVNIDKFQDGDRNTAILDLDGSLTGFKVVDRTTRMSVPGAAPISLNNLPINHSSNSVDECQSEGVQNSVLEGRPTSLISPGSMGTLEFQAIWPNPKLGDVDHWQILTFTKDSPDFGQRQTMEMKSRNGQGIWEPKVTHGYGYTVAASNYTPPGYKPYTSGIPAVLSVGVTDVVKPHIGKDNPFKVRIGICYTGKNGSHPPKGNFRITRGYRSWGGGALPTINDPLLNKYWNKFDNRYKQQVCYDLNNFDPRNLDPKTGCPADGVTAAPDNVNDPCRGGGRREKDQQGREACIYDRKALTSVGNISALDLDTYFYDDERGMLYFYVAQTAANAVGPSPLGSCKGEATDDPTCPDSTNNEDPEAYYPCPARGCSEYVVRLDDDTYEPQPSACAPYPTYAQSKPVDPFQLIDKDTNVVVQPKACLGKDGIKHRAATTPPLCAANDEPCVPAP